jgi:hypothetical protein
MDMREDREKKVEASVPVQTRVDVRSLAEMLLYFDNNQVVIRTMSQLVSWSVEVAREILKENEVLVREFELTEEAHGLLVGRGLYQQSMYSRGRKKLSASMRFDNLRGAGRDPKSYVPREYNILHNKKSVDVYDEREVGKRKDEMMDQVGSKNVISREKIDEMVKIYHELEKKDLDEARDRAKEAARKSGQMVVVSGEQLDDAEMELDRIREEDEKLAKMGVEEFNAEARKKALPDN